MEPDEGGKTLFKKLNQSRLRSRIGVIKLKGYKDASKMYIADPEGFQKAFRKARKAAVPMIELPHYAYDKINKGNRNIKLTSIAGGLRAEGYQEDELRDALFLINQKKCKPPLPGSEVESIVDSVKKYELGHSGVKGNSLSIFRDELLNDLETFHTSIYEPYAVIDVEDHQEVLEINSNEFNNLLQKKYYNKYKKTISQADLNTITDLLKATAKFESPEKAVHIRLAGSEREVYLDLANKNREVVKITPDGWEIIREAPYYFIRPPGAKALPYPKRSKKQEFKLEKFLNAEPILITSWLVGAMNPSGPYPILVLQGGPDSAKSTATRMLKQLIDPSKGNLRKQPRNSRDLMVSTRNSWVLAFNNLSTIQKWFSDDLCQLATGGGLSVRKNYTDKQEQIFNAVRPVILNGIDYLTVRADLADRAIVIELPPITQKDRKAEKVFWKKFEKRRPYILGNLLDGVSHALKDLDTVNLKFKPRMLDFTQWVVAAEPAMPWKNGLFLKKYAKNQKIKNRINLNNDDLAITILDFMSSKKYWEGNAQDLWQALKQDLIKQHKDIKEIPNGPAALAKDLRRTEHILRKNGLEVNFKRTSAKKIIKIKKKIQ
jgi:hypothetical protein